MRLFAFLFLTLAQLTGVNKSHADDIEQFYKGRTINIVVGNGQGAGNDSYSRLLARHLGSHLKGRPGAVVSNMPGASGLVAFNWLANVAPRDGSTIATTSFTIPFEPIFGNAAARFHAPDFAWIGNMESGVSVCVARVDSGIDRFEDLLKQELTVGAAASTGFPSQASRALMELLGVRLKLIEGYVGTAAIKLATERSEVQGICGISASTIRAQWQELIKSETVKIILQLSATPDPNLSGVPHVFDFVHDGERRAVLSLIFGPQELGRAFATPPGVRKERVDTLREAFMATMRDDDFRADALKMGLDLKPQSGRDVQAVVEALYAASPAIVGRAKKLLGQ